MTLLNKGLGPADAWIPLDGITCGRMVGATCGEKRESVCVRGREGGARQRLPCSSLSPSRPPHAIFSTLALPSGSQALRSLVSTDLVKKPLFVVAARVRICRFSSFDKS